MSKSSPQLDWCIVKVSDDENWWVEEISDPIHWDVDGLGIVDPKQVTHIIDLCDSLRVYGFDPSILEDAFFKFRIDSATKDKRVKLSRVKVSIIDGDEELFALPNIMDEEKGPYADFLDQITKFRVKMLNDLIDFEQKLTIDELEDEIRERQNSDLMEGIPVHFFNEITTVLEYVPEGFEGDLDEEISSSSKNKDADLNEFPEIEVDEKIVEDETMKWDDGGDSEKDEDDMDDIDDDIIIKKPKRGRPRKT